MTLRTLRFHTYGEPAEVLQIERAPIPTPSAGRIRTAVHACGLNPADWALCRGLFPGQLPRGVGLDVAGVVDAVGEGVTDVAIGDRVVGTADYTGSASAGASDLAIMNHWWRAPETLDLVQAAALPMAVETAFRHLDNLSLTTGQTILIHGGGTMVGFAAVQMALLRGARVIATAGETHAERLRLLGARVTSYGDGMVERIQELAEEPVELALDTAPVSGALPDLVRAVGGVPSRVLTMSDFKSAAALGVRTSFGEANTSLRYDVLGQFVERAAEGTFTVPVSRTFPLEDWRAALEISLSGRARGKLVLVIASGHVHDADPVL